MSSVEPFPLSLSSDQQDVIARAAAALVPGDRDAFLRAVGHRLRGETIGDGSVALAIRDVSGRTPIGE
jgi:hypothetical protein